MLFSFKRFIRDQSDFCKETPINRNFIYPIEAQVEIAGVSYVTEILINGPNGSIVGALKKLTNEIWYKNFTWIPTQLGFYNYCVTAFDNLGQSKSLCYNLSVETYDSRPIFQNASGTPRNILSAR